jgi:hypothetical protein
MNLDMCWRPCTAWPLEQCSGYHTVPGFYAARKVEILVSSQNAAGHLGPPEWWKFPLNPACCPAGSVLKRSLIMRAVSNPVTWFYTDGAHAAVT